MFVSSSYGNSLFQRPANDSVCQATTTIVTKALEQNNGRNNPQLKSQHG
jgi:hypothetical protein